eukprot:TRINITY_DN8644_c0_g1_i1.p1 TRINITY_DN8644_c0_g1~~TRINITY_DN8644_c0_g1_i1.p1  ORF type:complete len:434 (-),score=79.56 TRINITY_DN8644_c0_g1_i1:35-1216(-)
MGGPETINKTLQTNDKFLELNFRPGCPYSHPIFANRISTSNFLLTVKKKSHTSNEFDFAITGLIPSTYAFRGMADFQCIVSRETEEVPQVEPKDMTNFGVPQTRELKMIPTIFSSVDVPQNYNFEANTLFTKDEKGEWVLKSNQKKKTTSWNITGKAAEIPKVQPYALRKDMIPIYKRLKELFDSRPIWLKTALSMNIPKEMQAKLGRVLPTIAYYFKSGPWRVCWVRLGYDPRKDPESYIYQSIDFRIPEQDVKKIRNRAGEDKRKYYQPSTLPRKDYKLLDVDLVSITSQDNKGEEKKVDINDLEQNLVHTFSRVPTNVQSFYQYIDINIESVRKLLSKPNSKYSPRSGWMSTGTISGIRRIMMNQLKKLLKAVENQDPNNTAVEEALESC